MPLALRKAQWLRGHTILSALTVLVYSEYVQTR